MDAVLVKQIGAAELVTVPDPVAGEDESLVKVEVTGVCRTDLKVVRAGHRDLILPRIPGEEVVGTVVEGGTAECPPGSRVYVYPGQWCGACPRCRAGQENLCTHMRIMGFHRDGGFAETVSVPNQSLMPVPEGLSPEIAVFAEPLSCCLNALELARLAEGETLGIWGAGPAGRLLGRAARARGATTHTFDPDPKRLAAADNPATQPDAFDVIVVAVGSVEAYEEALPLLAPHGRLVVFSGLSPDVETRPVSFNQLHYLQQTLVGAYGCCPRHSLEALDLLASGRVIVEDLITHRLPLSAIHIALDVVAERSGIKVLLYPHPHERETP